MRAFTQLCEKVNISLFDDTITLYPKKNGKKQPVIACRLIDNSNKFFPMMEECMYEETTKVIRRIIQENALDISRFVLYDEDNHARYHDDNFDQKDTHYHVLFPQTIDEIKLEKILCFFVENELLSSIEKGQFLESFKKANTIDEPFEPVIQQDDDTLISNKTIPQATDTALKQQESLSFQYDAPTFFANKRKKVSDKDYSQQKEEKGEPKNKRIKPSEQNALDIPSSENQTNTRQL